MEDLFNLGALLNPNTNPNIHYMSPVPKPMDKRKTYNVIPDDEFAIETNVSTEMDNIPENYIMNGNGHLKVNNGDITNYIVPPNSTRDESNKSNGKHTTFNYKRLSQTLAKVNMSAIADVDRKSETDEENEHFNDITYDSSDTYYDDNRLRKTETKLERLEKLIQSFKMLQKELPNLLEINENSNVFQIKVPNLNKYENWQLNDIMFWISYLENGRFKRYEEKLMLGFAESGISAKQLPNLTTANLSAPPFNIKIFRDKRDLIGHFKSLRKNN